LISLLPVVLGGCWGTKHLEDGQKLLLRQHIQAPREIDTDALRGLYVQRPNRKFLGIAAPLVEIYYLGKSNYKEDSIRARLDRKNKRFERKIRKAKTEKRKDNLAVRQQKMRDRLRDKLENGNTVMQWGEPVSAFDSANVQSTIDRFNSYLFSKGYFTNKVTAKISQVRSSRREKKNRFLQKLVQVSYKVEPGQPYLLDSMFYSIQDTAVLALVLKNQKANHLKPGDRYDESNLTKERERLAMLMKDNGYFDFSKQYIEYWPDTSYLKPGRRVMMMIEIKDPAQRGYHKKFIIDSVNFTTDLGLTQAGRERTARFYRGIRYQYYEDIYNLKILSQRVFIKPGELYSESKKLDTQRQLANLEAFKFANIDYDTAQGRFVANILTSPLARYEWTNEAGVSVTQGFPGPFYNMTFRKRNIFNGLETFDLSGRIGFEGVAPATSDQDFYKSTEAGVNASITFPQFIWPFREKVRFKHAQFNPKTKFTAGYAFTKRPEYTRTAWSLNGTYSWNNKRTRLYTFTPVNLSVIDTSELSPGFRELLAEQESLGNFSLKNSFRPSFVNSMIFAITWNHNNYGNAERNSAFIRTQFESGGTIWNIFNGKFITEQYQLEYFQYLRLSLDMRRINVMGRNTTIAYRFNSGLAYAYGDNKSLPYEKFFFAGGSNSIRAWRPRRLGPGSFKPPISTDPGTDGLFDYSIEKPADILMEASLEIRQKLFGFVNGAIFLDAGNVWTFEPRSTLADESSTGSSQFKPDSFFKEIAVGTGFGLRFDFTFLILRFDVGIKVWDPARSEGDRFVLDKLKFFGPFSVNKEPVIYNVGIGYPF
jgi:outer membrane protein insertion porin family